MGYIYIHTNKVNGKKYVGQTTRRPEQRWMNGRGYRSNEMLNSDIEEYGWESFEHEVRRCPNCLLDVMEQNLTEYYDTMNPEKGYNQTSGGKKGFKQAEETRKKISEAKKGKHPSEETVMESKDSKG